MEYYNNIKCISVDELTKGDSPIMSRAAYDQYVYRFPHIRIRRGSPAGPALLAWNSLRDDLKARYIAKYGDPDKAARRNVLAELIAPDVKAAQYFANYELEDGRYLPFDRQVEYTTNAVVLNAIHRLVTDRKSKTRALGNSTKNVWAIVAGDVNELDKAKYPHSLPANAVRLKDKLKAYMMDGYPSLIHKGFANNNSRKVNEQLERLLISIYCMRNLPFGEWVQDYYMRFLAGDLEIVDTDSGETYDRADFFDERKGAYITISRATVWNVLNNPANQIIIDRLRNNRIDHITQHTPFNHRKLPTYSLSKISMDDRTFSRKTEDGKWYNAYVAFDVLSGAILGSVRSVEKPTINMVWDCFRDMYSNLEANGLMWPGEVEVENHLMKEIEGQLRQMFAFVTFTTPGLSRSKRAEHLIRGKKYGDEKRNQEGIGRWSGKGAYKTKSESKDEDYKQPRLSVSQLDAEERESIERYNHELHPDQKRFKGKTRWQVLCENVNPDLGRPQKYKLMRFIGLETKTSLRNNDFVRVRYENYAIDTYDVLRRMKANNSDVTAYYLPAPDGEVSEVFVYQQDQFLTRASKIERYQEAKMERTADDERIRTEQAKRQANFFRREKEGIDEKVDRTIAFVPVEQKAVIEQVQVQVVDTPELQDESIESILKRYNDGWYSEKAIDDI